MPLELQREGFSGGGDRAIKIPSTYKDAMASPQSAQWQEAIDKEMEA